MSTILSSDRTAATSRPVRTLKAALGLDAAVTGVVGVASLAAAATPLGDELGLPVGFLVAVGAFLVAYAAGLGRFAASARPSRTGVAIVIAVNVVWVIESVVLVALDAFSPTVAGQVVLLVQAAGVAGFALLQHLARRAV